MMAISAVIVEFRWKSGGEEGMEVRVEGPSWDKGKGWALASEEARGEVSGVVCDLCDKKGIPCRWGKVYCLLTSSYRRPPAFGPAWAANKPGQNAMLEVQGLPRGNGQGRRRARRRGPAGRCG